MKFLFLYFWYIFSINYFKTDKLYYKYYERCYEYYEYYERYYKILRVVLRDTKRWYKWYYETLRGTTSGTMSHYEILRVVLQDTARYYGWYHESLCGTKRHFERFSITRRVVPRDVTILGQVSWHCVLFILDFKNLAKFLRLQCKLVDVRNLPNYFLEFLVATSHLRVADFL